VVLYDLLQVPYDRDINYLDQISVKHFETEKNIGIVKTKFFGDIKTVKGKYSFMVSSIVTRPEDGSMWILHSLKWFEILLTVGLICLLLLERKGEDFTPAFLILCLTITFISCLSSSSLKPDFGFNEILLLILLLINFTISRKK